MTKPQILIIAGGKNSRFFPLNSRTHKGFLTLLGKPLIIWTLISLQSHGYTNIVIVVSNKDFDQARFNQLLKEYKLALQVTLVVQPQPRGMGNAILCAKSLLKRQFVVLGPYHPLAGETVNHMLSAPNPNVVATVTTDTPWLYGIVTLQAGLATGITEKPAKGKETSSQKIRTIYSLTPEFLTILSQQKQTEDSFESALNQLMHTQAVSAIQLPHDIPSIKYPWHLFDLRSSLFTLLKSHQSSQATIASTAVIDESAGPVIIKSGATISHASRLVGPCYIGKNAFVGDFSLVRESSLEAGVKIGVHADLTRSIFFPHATFHGGGFIGDSIIGAGSKIGAGFITANKRFDRQNVHGIIKSAKTDTLRQNFGCVLGEQVKIGVQVSILPGRLIGARTTIPPHTLVSNNTNHQPENNRSDPLG